MREMTTPEIQEALDLRQDGVARVWGYQCSHSWFELRITSPSLAGNFHIKCGGCTRCTFDIQIARPKIQIQPAPEGAGHGWIVQDGDRLQIHCDIIIGNYNVQPVFQ